MHEVNMAWLLGINIAEPTFGVDCDRIGNSMVITTQKSQKKTMHPAVLYQIEVLWLLLTLLTFKVLAAGKAMFPCHKPTA